MRQPRAFVPLRRPPVRTRSTAAPSARLGLPRLGLGVALAALAATASAGEPPRLLPGGVHGPPVAAVAAPATPTGVPDGVLAGRVYEVFGESVAAAPPARRPAISGGAVFEGWAAIPDRVRAEGPTGAVDVSFKHGTTLCTVTF